jgi:hypothetical protein
VREPEEEDAPPQDNDAPTGAALYLCPHCAQEVDTAPDPGGGEQQEYVEDCPVCCRPNVIHASFSPEDDAYVVYAEPE